MAQTPQSLLERLRKHPDDRMPGVGSMTCTGRCWLWIRRYAVQPQDADDLVQQVLEVVVREMPGSSTSRRRADSVPGCGRSWSTSCGPSGGRRSPVLKLTANSSTTFSPN